MTVAVMSRRTTRGPGASLPTDPSLTVFGWQVDGVWNRPLDEEETRFAAALLRYTAGEIELRGPNQDLSPVSLQADPIPEAVRIVKRTFEQVRIAKLVVANMQEEHADAVRTLIRLTTPQKTASLLGVKMSQLPKAK